MTRDQVMRRGLTLIELLVTVTIIGLLAGLLLPAVQKVRGGAAKAECADRMRQVGLALHNYHTVDQKLPTGLETQKSKSGMPYLGWPARVLPHVEQDALWAVAGKAFATSSHFLDPAHAAVREAVLPLFICPSDDRLAAGKRFRSFGVAFTSYLGSEGLNQNTKDGLLFADSQVRFADVTDGLSPTLLLGERPPSADLYFGWWYAGWGQDKDGSAEMILGVRESAVHNTLRDCPSGSSVYRAGRISEQCDALHFWSLHPGGANFLFADGSVRFLKYSADKIMPALATRAGGEAVSAPE